MENSYQDSSEKRLYEKYNRELDKALEKEKKSIFGFFIRNFRITYLIIAMIVIVGIFSMLTLPRESEPEVKVPYASVTTIYLGASPTDVEDLITNKIEDKVKNLDNLHRFTSTSGLGFSSVFVEFEADADLQESFRELRDEISSIGSGLPSESESPVVTEVRMNDFPIVTYSLIGDYDDVELKYFADNVRDELENVKDVSGVVIVGGVEREFQVIVDQTKLAHFNISLGQVVSSIQGNNFDMPAGDIEVDGFEYGVRIKGKLQDVSQLGNVVITTYNESPVFLSDVALVKDGYKEKVSQSQIGFKNEEPKNAISLMIYKKTGGNILQMTEDAQIKIDELIENELPDDLFVQKTNDNSKYVKDDLRILGTSAVQTFILITIILMLILSFRGAVITALAVPLAFFMSFTFLKLQGMTLNSMVLFSLVLSLGLMVDNAIVIIEGINEYFEKYKRTIQEASILSVWNFRKAITSGTMTTVSAFLPLLLVSGIMGEYMSIIPKTLVVTLLSSLFVALIVMPTIVSRAIKVKKTNGTKNRSEKRHEKIGKIMDGLYKKYSRLLNDVLPNKKKRRKYIVSAWILFFIAIAVPISGLMKIEMFPTIDFDYFTVDIELPVGSTLEKTAKIAHECESLVSQISELDNYVTVIGSSGGGWGGGAWSSGQSSLHKAAITVNLVDDSLRDRASYDIADDFRKKIKSIQGAKVLVSELTAGPPSGAPVEVRIFGGNLGEMAVVSNDVKNYLEGIEELVNVDDSMEDATGEFTFVIDKQKANFYGLNTMIIASTLRNAVYGTKASVVNLDNEDIDITVRYGKDKITNVNDLENILLFTPRGDSIVLSQVAELRLEPSLTSISHRDGDQIVSITADTKDGANLQDVMKEIDVKISSMQLPDGFSIAVGGETEDIERSFRDIFTSMIVAVILIAFILVLQFNSFKQPLIILFSLPLAVIGVIIGLNIFRQAFSFTVFIGIVSLSGIVVNDAIVLIDRINKNLKNGMDFVEGIIEGGVARMQPIFLTSLTTIAGIFPLIYANDMWRGLSLSVIFGLLFSTILNLIIVPILYASFCKKDYDKEKNKEIKENDQLAL